MISGNGSVWHGFADLFVDKSIVKVAEVTDDTDEPIEKRRKYDNYDDDSDSGRSFESNSEFKVKRDCIGAKDISQGLAQTIVNAFCEVQKNVTLKNTFIPSFIISYKYIKIAMYYCELDRLILTPDLRLLVKLDAIQEPFLDFSTILTVWFALNFEIFVDKQEIFEEVMPVSNFQKLAGSRLPFYKNLCCKPMVEKVEISPSDYKLHPESQQIVGNVLDRQLEHCRQLNALLSNMS
jgi:hypothetical protein